MTTSEDRGQRESPALGQARLATRITWDEARLARLARGLVTRRRRRRVRWAGAAGAVATAALALIIGRAEWRPLAPSATSARPPVAIATHRERIPTFTPPLVDQAGVERVDAGALVPVVAAIDDLAADPHRAARLWAAHGRNPGADLILPDVSRAGYHPGGAGPAPAALVDVRSFGAAGDGKTDDTQAIRRAIASVGARGGVVYLPNGDYQISGVLFVNGNGTVLRGEDQAKTRLLFTRPLDRAMGANVKGPNSRWQWAGGLVWFAPPGRNVPQQLAREEDQPEKAVGGSWQMGPPLAAVSVPAARGDLALTLSGPAAVRPGDLVLLALDAAPALLSAGWHKDQDLRHAGAGPGGAGGVIRWPVEIAAVAGNTVTLAQPLRFDVPKDLHPHLHAVREDSLIRDVGIERLSLVMQREPPPPGLAEPFGWNGPFFQQAVHAFARELTLVDGDLGVLAVASKNLTVSDVELQASPGAVVRPSQMAMTLRAHSHDVLIERVRLDPRRWLGLRIEGSGFVLSKASGCLANLRGPAVQSVVTETVNAPCPPVPGGPARLLGEPLVGWNLRTSAAVEPHDAQLWGDLPPNLYEAERALPAPR